MEHPLVMVVWVHFYSILFLQDASEKVERTKRHQKSGSRQHNVKISFLIFSLLTDFNHYGTLNLLKIDDIDICLFMQKPLIAPCCLNSFHSNKLVVFFNRNISTASFNMQKTLKNITARCLQKPKNSRDQLPTGTPTQSGNKRRRLRESRRRGWGDLWWEPQSQHFTLVRHQNSISKCLHSFRNNMKRFRCLTFKVLFNVATNINMSFFLCQTTASISLISYNYYIYAKVPNLLL